MGDVEKGCGFVEQQDRCLLGQNHGKPDPLALSAGQFVHETGSKVADPCRCHRRADGSLVGRGPLAEHRLVRVAAARHQLFDRDAIGCDRTLRQKSEPARDVPGGKTADAGAIENDLSLSGLQQARQGAQQRRLAAGIRTDDHRKGPIRDGDRELAGNRQFPVAQRHGICAQSCRHLRPSLTSTHMK